MWMVRIWHPGPTGPDSALAGAAHRTCKWKPAWHEWTNMVRDWQIYNIEVMMSTSHFHAPNLYTWTMYACVYLHLAPKLHMKVDRGTNLTSSSPNLWDQWNKNASPKDTNPRVIFVEYFGHPQKTNVVFFSNLGVSTSHPKQQTEPFLELLGEKKNKTLLDRSYPIHP